MLNVQFVSFYMKLLFNIKLDWDNNYKLKIMNKSYDYK